MQESEDKRDTSRSDVADMARALPDHPGLPMAPRAIAVMAEVIATIIENEEGSMDSSDKTNRRN